jgi:hypothetical protein
MIQLDQGLLSNTYCLNVDFVENSLNSISQIFVPFPNTLVGSEGTGAIEQRRRVNLQLA